jgi:transglutaminase-like putative cysteine protease
LDAWLRRHWTIIADPPEAEFIMSPALMLGCGWLAGDCDDAATLTAAVLIALGIRAVFMAIRTARDTDFSHVFVRVPAYGLDIDPIVPASQIPIQYQEAMVLEI